MEMNAEYEQQHRGDMEAASGDLSCSLRSPKNETIDVPDQRSRDRRSQQAATIPETANSPASQQTRPDLVPAPLYATRPPQDQIMQMQPDSTSLQAVEGNDEGLAAQIEQTSPFSQNLLEVFGLSSIAQSVARFDPDTGEKINKMRKSYEGQLKGFGLSGRNKAVPYVETAATSAAPMSLVEMAQWPAEEWYNQRVRGHDVMVDSWQTARERIFAGLKLRTGHLKDDIKWQGILGLDRGAGKPEGERSTYETRPRSHADDRNAARPARARRNVKKRRYDDGSFEGYGEGFLDDDGDLDGGYESAETLASMDSRGERKRRKIRLGLG